MCVRVSVRLYVCDVDVKYAIRDMVANLRRIKIEHLRQMQLICNESIGTYEYGYRNESAATATALTAGFDVGGLSHDSNRGVKRTLQTNAFEWARQIYLVFYSGSPSNNNNTKCEQ